MYGETEEDREFRKTKAKALRAIDKAHCEHLRLRQLAIHIQAMEGDPYLGGHPEWREIVKEAKEALDQGGKHV